MESTSARERIYDIFADPTTSFETMLQRSLQVGTEYLDLPYGFVSRIEGGTQEIVHAVGDHDLLQPGETCPLDAAYCRRTIEIESPLAVTSADASPDVADAAFETFGLGTYVGCRIVGFEDVYGTVCFADTAERATPFTDAEVSVVELLARLIGQTLERRTYERRLRRRERELDERRELYRTIIDASFDLVFRIDPEGRFTYVSPPIEDLLGYPPDHYVGEPFTRMLPDEPTIELAGDLFEQVMAGQTVERQYFPLDHRGSQRVFADVRVTPVYDVGVSREDATPADIVGVQGVARDATDRYRRDRLIRVLNRVLRHNLRNEITVISGFTAELRESLPPEDLEMADRILETTDELLNLSETARTFERYLDDAPDLEPADVVPVVRRVAERVDDQYPEARVTVEGPGSALARSAPQLETALRELVDNAAKHAGDAPDVDVVVSSGDDHVSIRVADDGPGLPDQERQVLAEGEETPLVHGSGLGLWLVYWVVQRLDGALAVDASDAGTTVELRLQPPTDA